MPSAAAATFTGGALSSPPRPLGRSGCVTTSTTSCPARTRCSSVGRANSGVPAKTSFMVSKFPSFKKLFASSTRETRNLKLETVSLHPLPRLRQLLDLALHQVALQRGDVADVQLAVQVVGLVHEGARQQVLADVLVPFAVQVLRPHRDLLRTRHRLAE